MAGSEPSVTARSNGKIHIDTISVARHNGGGKIDEVNTIIRAGEKVLPMGESAPAKAR